MSLILQVMSIVLFVYIIFSFGFSLLNLLKIKFNKYKSLELIFVNLAVGLVFFNFLINLFDLFSIPQNISIYFLLATLYPTYMIFFNKKVLNKILSKYKNINFTSIFILLVLISSVFLLFMFTKGAFRYPHLEDSDPWGHATASLYVALEKTYYQSKEIHFNPYLPPYPPNFDVLNGLVVQINKNINWTLKFFNSFLLALSILFYYLMFKEITNSHKKAAIASFILVVLPGSFSHFIWAQTLAMTIFPITIFSMLLLIKNKFKINYGILYAVSLASMMITHPFVSAIFAFVVIIFIFNNFVVDIFKNKNLINTLNFIKFNILGIFLSLFYWMYQLIFVQGISYFFDARAGEFSKGGGWVSGYAQQVYNIKDFLYPPLGSRIDQATGYGLYVSVFTLLGVLFYLYFIKISFFSKIKKHKNYDFHLPILIWFFSLLFLLFNVTLGFNIPGVARSWAYLAIPLAILASEGIYNLSLILTKNKSLKLVLIFIMLGLIAYNSGVPRYSVQTSVWNSGSNFNTQDELNGYINLKNSNRQFYILAICDDGHLVIGNNQIAKPWKQDLHNYYSYYLYNASVVKNSSYIINYVDNFINKYDFNALIISTGCIKYFDINTTQELLTYYSNRYPLYKNLSNNGFFIFQINKL